MTDIQEAMILAAGVGSRLASRHGGLPKCLVPVAGVPIIVRQLQALKEVGVRRVVVVTGYERERVERAVLDAASDLSVIFVHNDRYRETNVLASWFAGSEALTGDYYYMHADTVYETELLRRLQEPESHGEIWLSVDTHRCAEEEMKVVANADRVIEIAKTLDPNTTLGEFTGVLRAPRATTHHLRRLAAYALARPDGSRQFFERALQLGIDGGDVVVRWVDVTGLRWREIDFPEDLDAAERIFADS